MIDLDDQELALLSRARAGLSPSAEQASRVHESVLRALASAPLAGLNVAELQLPGTSTGSVLGKLAFAKPLLMSALAVGTAIAAAAYAPAWLATGPRAPDRMAAHPAKHRPATTPLSTASTPTRVQPSTQPASNSPDPSAGSGPLQVPKQIPHVSNRKLPPVSPESPRATRGSNASALASGRTPPSQDSLQSELTGLRSVEAALSQTDPRSALTILTALDRKYPQGQLLDERAVLGVLARCQLDPASGRAAAATLTARPRSLYAHRLRSQCGIESTPIPALETRFPGSSEE